MKKFLDKIGFLYNLVRAKTLNEVRPFWTCINITNACNLRCKYCIERFPNRKEQAMSFDQIDRIVDEVIELGTYEICLTGGEALLHKDLEYFVTKIKKNRARCSIITNGWFVERKMSIIKMLDLVTISLDGSETDNDFVRGKGTYSAVLKSLDMIKEAGIPCSIKVTLNKHNLNSFTHVLDIAREYGFMVSFGSLVAQISEDGKDKLPPDELPDDVEYKKAVTTILDKQQEGSCRILNSPKSLRYFLNWPLSFKDSTISDDAMRSLKSFDPIPCYGGRFFIVIDSNGELYPCSTLINRAQSFNCIEMGVKKAMELASKHSCKACHFISNNDQNLMFDLNLAQLLHLIRVNRA